MIFACALIGIARAGIIGGGHALSTQSIVLGAPAIAHGYGGYGGYAAAAPAIAAPALGIGLGTV